MITRLAGYTSPAEYKNIKRSLRLCLLEHHRLGRAHASMALLSAQAFFELRSNIGGASTKPKSKLSALLSPRAIFDILTQHSRRGNCGEWCMVNGSKCFFLPKNLQVTKILRIFATGNQNDKEDGSKDDKCFDEKKTLEDYQNSKSQ